MNNIGVDIDCSNKKPINIKAHINIIKNKTLPLTPVIEVWQNSINFL